MAILPILIEPHPRLHEMSAPVDVVSDEIRQLLDDMVETMYANQGGGLAAPQVDVRKRVIVMDSFLKREDWGARALKMVNPQIVWRSLENQTNEEGCLSIPNQYVRVMRSAEVRVQYLDEKGDSQEFHAKEYHAICVQHEIDHLDGILSLDYLSPLKRGMILRKLQKEKKIQKEKKSLP